MSSKDGFQEMYKVVCSIISRRESSVFREPVDWKALGLTDYPEVVKKPMDLGTIKSKIENDKYGSMEDIAADIRLVWSNCMLYNWDGSEVSLSHIMIHVFAYLTCTWQYYHIADKFAKAFEETYTALRRLEDSKSDMDRIPTVEEKMQLSYDIFKIGNNEMAKVLTLIESSCPSGLSRKASTEEVLINFDTLTPRCFHEVNSFVMACILGAANAKKGKKKKATAASAPVSTTTPAASNSSSSTAMDTTA